jgi:hypothetical protein
VAAGSTFRPTASVGKAERAGLAVDANHPEVVATGANDQIDIARCGAGNWLRRADAGAVEGDVSAVAWPPQVASGCACMSGESTLVIGPVIAACGFAMFAIPSAGGSYWTTFFPAAVVLGFGMTLTVAPLTTTVMQSVAPTAVGVASGVNNAVSSVASLLAIASFGMVMSRTFDVDLSERLAAASLSPQIVAAVQSQRAKLAAIDIPSSASPEARASIQDAVAASFVTGFRRVMLIAALLALASAASAWLMIGRRRSTRDSAAGGESSFPR